MNGKSSVLRGFTLLELLISLTIMMMIFTLGFQGYRLYSQSWQRDLSDFQDSFEQYKTLDLFTTALYGIIPSMVKNGDRQAFYFLGRGEGFTAISMAPIFNPGASAVIRVFKEPQQDGKFQLVYEEASLRDLVLVTPDQLLPFEHRLVVMTDLPAIGFRYFGLSSKESLFNAISDDNGQLPSQQWYDEYDGLKTELHPSKLLLQLDQFELQIPIPQRSQLGEVIPEVLL